MMYKLLKNHKSLLIVIGIILIIFMVVFRLIRYEEKLTDYEEKLIYYKKIGECPPEIKLVTCRDVSIEICTNDGERKQTSSSCSCGKDFGWYTKNGWHKCSK